MRYLFTILLFLPVFAFGQRIVPFGATRTEDTSRTTNLKATGTLQLPYYVNDDTNRVLTLVNGTLQFVTKGSGGDATMQIQGTLDTTNRFVKLNTSTIGQSASFHISGSGKLYKGLLGDIASTTVASSRVLYIAQDSTNPVPLTAGSAAISRTGLEIANTIGYTATPPATVQVNGIAVNTNIKSTNTQNLGSSVSHPNVRGLSIAVNTQSGSSGTIKYGAALYATMTGAATSARFIEANLLNLTYENTLKADKAAGLRLSDVDVGTGGNASVFISAGDADTIPNGNFAFIDNTGSPSYLQGLYMPDSSLPSTHLYTLTASRSNYIDSLTRRFRLFVDGGTWSRRQYIGSPTKSTNSSDSVMVRDAATGELRTYAPISSIGGGGSGTVTSFSATSSTLSTSVATATTTPALTVNLSSIGAGGTGNTITYDQYGRVTGSSNADYATNSTVTTGLATKENTITGSGNALDYFTGNKTFAALPDQSATNEIQNLSLAGTSLGISGGTGVTLAASNVGLGNVPNVDATNPANITQSASYRFTTDAEKTSWNNKLDAEVDGSTSNEIQSLTQPTDSSIGLSLANTLNLGSIVRFIGDQRYFKLSDTGMGWMTDGNWPDNSTRVLGTNNNFSWAFGANGVFPWTVSNSDQSLSYSGTATVPVNLTTSTTNNTSFQFQVTNTRNSSSSGNASMRLQVGGANAGDPYVSYSISGVDTWVTGVDNSASDIWGLWRNTTPGTNPLFTVTTAGNATVTGSVTATNSTTPTTGTASGNGSATQIDITLPVTPTFVVVQAGSAAAAGITYATPITNGVRIFYTVAPATGTNNLTYYILYR